MDSVTSSAVAPTFEEYVGSAWPSLYRYAYLLTANHADAEDLAQQTLLKAYRVRTNQLPRLHAMAGEHTRAEQP